MGAMHANCYRNIEGVELAAVADIRREKAEALAAGGGVQIFGDGMELIEQADVNIIDIFRDGDDIEAGQADIWKYCGFG